MTRRRCLLPPRPRQQQALALLRLAQLPFAASFSDSLSAL
jgi:hypothetical protein